MYFAAILEIDGRSEHDLVSPFNAVTDLDLGPKIANFSDLAAVRDTVLNHQNVETVPIEDDGTCRHDK